MAVYERGQQVWWNGRPTPRWFDEHVTDEHGRHYMAGRPYGGPQHALRSLLRRLRIIRIEEFPRGN